MNFHYTSVDHLVSESWGNGTRKILFQGNTPPKNSSRNIECFVTEWETHGIFAKSGDGLQWIIPLEGTPRLRTGDREQTLATLDIIEYPGNDPMESFGSCKLLHITTDGSIVPQIHMLSMEPDIPYTFPYIISKTLLYCYDWPMVLREDTFEQNLYPGDALLLKENCENNFAIYSDRKQILIAVEFIENEKGTL